MTSTVDLAWAAGFLDGEGTFYVGSNGRGHMRLSVKAAQVQRWPLDRLATLFGGNIYFCRGGRGNQQDYYVWSLSGAAAAGLMMSLAVLLSPRRRQTIVVGLGQWKTWPVSSRYRQTCRHGHPFDVTVNSTRDGEYRACRRCKQDAQHRYTEKARVAVS